MNFKVFVGKLYYRMLFSIYMLFFFAKEHSDTCKDKKCSKYVHNPLESADKGCSYEYKNETHDNSSQYSPYKHLVIILFSNFKWSEYKEYNENIINR